MNLHSKTLAEFCKLTMYMYYLNNVGVLLMLKKKKKKGINTLRFSLKMHHLHLLLGFIVLISFFYSYKNREQLSEVGGGKI